VSIGGQAYGSVTEDYNTAMHLMSAGFATMYLNERLVFGMVPEDIQGAAAAASTHPKRRSASSRGGPTGPTHGCMLASTLIPPSSSAKSAPPRAIGVFCQRLRWAMGALQILYRSNPLAQPGLTLAQRWLFFEAAAYHYLAIPTVMFSLLPLAYLVLDVAPVAVSPRQATHLSCIRTGTAQRRACLSSLVAPRCMPIQAPVPLLQVRHMWEFVAAFVAAYLANRLMVSWLRCRLYLLDHLKSQRHHSPELLPAPNVT
jgi:cellulose synthase/poly-beta-1,6-N-acetylglucosamine synthase-like glycosyltransferase